MFCFTDLHTEKGHGQAWKLHSVVQPHSVTFMMLCG